MTVFEHMLADWLGHSAIMCAALVVSHCSYDACLVVSVTNCNSVCVIVVHHYNSAWVLSCPSVFWVYESQHSGFMTV